MPRPWVKSWTNVLDKRKIMSLPGDVYKVWDLLCRMAGRYDNDGILPPLDDCAYVFHKDAKWMQGYFDDLCKRRLIDRVGDEYRMHDWQEWQTPGKPSDSPERIRERVTKHREKQRAAAQKDVVTPSNALRNAVTTEEKRREEKREDKEEREPSALTRVTRVRAPATTTQINHMDIFEALRKACGWVEGKPMTKSELSRLHANAKQVAEVGGNADEVERRAINFKERWGADKLTPNSLVGHWTECDTGPPVTNGRKSFAHQKLAETEMAMAAVSRVIAKEGSEENVTKHLRAGNEESHSGIRQQNGRRGTPARVLEPPENSR